MRASLKRCLAKPDFLLDFYGFFMAASPEAREKFRGTDLKRQTEVLSETLWVMALAADSEPGSPTWRDMPRLAEKHSRAGLNIGPVLYDQWLDSLVEAVRRHDPLYAPELEQAWRDALAPGIDYMRSRY
jgi:hemoglobin-like flavoprotein